MNRRGFLGGIFAAGIAPAFVGASVLMPVKKIIAPPEFVDATCTIERFSATYPQGDTIIYRAFKPYKGGIVFEDVRVEVGPWAWEPRDPAIARRINELKRELLKTAAMGPRIFAPG
jgi:hypothetical protein